MKIRKRDRRKTGMMAFQEMPYARPDMEGARRCYEDAIRQLNSAASYEEARTAFFDVQRSEKEAGTMSSLCMVRNTIDTADAFYEGERKWLREQNAGLIPLRKQFCQALAACRFRADFEKEFGVQLMKLVDASVKMSDEKI